ncbi:COX15/CtaA family protein [Chitinibacter sp. SCUT-21]|uniref:COX15/CtaA family protein n=1 Tax=Chitinibacter sp. SCUT-21 TaxID=2970891 RepID=UPI0035A66EE0
MRFSQRLLIVAIIWTALLMTLGAYVRLQDAGLGCPDWPGCYGHFTVPDEHHEIRHAEQHFGLAVDVAKGWKEMIHRYVASGLGVLIIVLSLVLWRERWRAGRNPWLALLPLVVILLQGAFGMWTVTLKLMPAVVTGHLIGGMSLLICLIVLLAREQQPCVLDVRWRGLWRLAIACVVAQIILGGWVSTNYAALACNGFPQCQGSWAMPSGLSEALRPDRELGLSANGVALNIEHLAAIHYLHRIGAMLVLAVVGALAWCLRHRLPLFACTLAAALLLQIALGISNVLLSLPLPLALAHHAGAAFLLSCLVYSYSRSSFVVQTRAMPNFNPQLPAASTMAKDSI